MINYKLNHIFCDRKCSFEFKFVFRFLLLMMSMSQGLYWDHVWFSYQRCSKYM